MGSLELIEDFTRYDHSKIWSIHHDYFQNCGIKAWKQGHIPYSGVSNYNEAYKKSRLIIENLRSMEHSGPVNIIEIGGGNAEFAKNFLHAFEDICKEDKLEYSDKLKYYFTDYSEITLKEVEDSGKLKKFSDKVVYKTYDVTKEPDFGVEFDVVMCNYLLDQLPARIFVKSHKEETPKFYEKYLKLEDKAKRLEEIKSGKNPPHKWIKKIKKSHEYRELNLDESVVKDPHELDVLKSCFRTSGECTVVYSYGALHALKNFMEMLSDNGIIICSDFSASTKPGIDAFEPCYYGNSLAQAVNFEFLFKYFAESQKVLLYEDPIRPLHTLILTKTSFEYALQLGENYDAIYKTNLIVRMTYRFLKEIEIGLKIFTIIVSLYLLKWLIFDGGYSFSP